jgi:Sulfotransferase family
MAEASAQGLAEEGSAQTSAPGPPKVIYVMGAGHSGSTILGVALGNCDGLFYAGELDEWLTTAGESPIGGTDRTLFWRRVREGVDDADPIFGIEAHRSIERSSSILRLGRLASRRRLRVLYRRVAEQLLISIAQSAGAATVVDSSHFPLRARELKALRGIDLFLVFLVRDPQGVVASELRGIHRHNLAERRMRTLEVNVNLWLTHLLSVIVFRSHPPDRRLFLRHEDFLADPALATRRILDIVGSDAPVPDFTALRTGFPLLANKLIDSEVVGLRDAAGPPARQSLLTALLQSPWKPVLARMRPRLRERGEG